jgi:hypothetical protein
MYMLVTMVPAFSPFSPTIPYHSDFWVYFNAMEKPLSYGDFLQPRPLSLILLRVIGWFGLGEAQTMLFFTLLSFVAIALSFLACESVNGVLASLPLRAFFVAMSMALPTYFLIYQEDFGGVAATILFCLALIVVSKPTNNAGKIITIIFLFLSFAFKPTWMAAAPMALGTIWLFNRHRKDALYIAFAAVVIAAAILLRDVLYGSTFIGTEHPDSPYKIGNLQQIISTFFYYVIQAVTIPSVGALGFTLLLFKCNYKTLFFSLAIAFGVLLPISLLPNHIMSMYAWYSSLFVLGAIASSGPPRWNTSRLLKDTNFTAVVSEDDEKGNSRPFLQFSFPSSTLNKYAYLLGYFVILLGILVLSAKQIDTHERNFVLEAQKKIYGDVQVLNMIKDLPRGKKILVGAMNLNPWTPFNNWEYVERVTQGKIKIDYLVRDDFAWTNLLPPKAIMSINKIRVEKYDYFLDLSYASGIPALIAVDDLNETAVDKYIAYLYCPGLAKLKHLENDNAQKNLEEASCPVNKENSTR